MRAKRNEVPVYLLPHQSQLVQDTRTRYLGIAAGLGAGKTHALVRKHHHLCTINSKSDSWYSAPTHELAKHVCIPAYTGYLTELGMTEGIHYSINWSELILTYHFTNLRTKVFFKTAQNWQRWVGKEIGHYTADEPARTPRQAFERGNERVRCPFARVHQTILGGTPDIVPKDDWYYDLFAGSQYEKLLKAGRVKLIRARTDENPFRPPGYLDTLWDNYQHNKNLLKCFVFGEFVVITENLAYDAYGDANLCQHPPNRNNLELHQMWDFNVNRVALSVGQIEKGNEFFAVAENARATPSTYDACMQFKEMFPPRDLRTGEILWENHKIIVHGDASGWASDTTSKHLFDSDYDLIRATLRPHYRAVEIMTPRSNPYIRTRIESTNRGFAKKRLMIHYSLVNLKDSLRRTTRDEASKIEKPSNDTWSDRSDGLSYWYTYYNPIVHVSETERILFN